MKPLQRQSLSWTAGRRHFKDNWSLIKPCGHKGSPKSFLKADLTSLWSASWILVRWITLSISWMMLQPKNPKMGPSSSKPERVDLPCSSLQAASSASRCRWTRTWWSPCRRSRWWPAPQTVYRSRCESYWAETDSCWLRCSSGFQPEEKHQQKNHSGNFILLQIPETDQGRLKDIRRNWLCFPFFKAKQNKLNFFDCCPQ